MCFDISQLKKKMPTILNRLRESTISSEILANEIDQLEMRDLFHSNGFDHPNLQTLSAYEKKWRLTTHQWGLIPHWVKDQTKADFIQNKTLNARIETVFEKPSFRDAAHSNRLIIPLDGFYEHHHKNGQKIAHYIYSINQEMLFVAAIGSTWYSSSTSSDWKTCSIVTCKANQTMSYIHNNPVLPAPRMPLILRDEHLNIWLEGSPDEMKKLVDATQQIQLGYHTVERLRGRRYIGNKPTVQQPRNYPEMLDPPTLF